MSKRDYYDVLGVARTASSDQIKRAYRSLARKFHPDVNKAAGAADRFKEAQEAYDVLSDPDKRRTYDQFGFAGPAGVGGGGAWEDMFGGGGRRRSGPSRGGPSRGGPSRGGRSRPGAGGSADPADFNPADFNPADLNAIFDELFGAARGQRGRTPGAGTGAGTGRGPFDPAGRGSADVEQPLTLAFEAAARGTTVPMRIQSEAGTETIEVKIPPGVAEGQKIRLRGRGNPGMDGVRGDLILTLHIQPHPVFRREGLDVYGEVVVSVYDAMLGGKVSALALDGAITLTIPPGTSSGAKLRIRGKGITRDGETGDHYAVVRIVVPRVLDEEASELVRRLARIAPVER